MAIAACLGFLTLLRLGNAWQNTVTYSSAGDRDFLYVCLLAATVAAVLLTGPLLTVILSGRMHRRGVALAGAGLLAVWLVLATVTSATQLGQGTTHRGMCLSYPMEGPC
jgi:uncharacterized membrane protein